MGWARRGVAWQMGDSEVWRRELGCGASQAQDSTGKACDGFKVNERV